MIVTMMSLTGCPILNQTVSTDDFFNEELGFPFTAEYEPVQIKAGKKWDVWCRTDDSLKTTFDEETQIFSLKHTGEKDYSVTISNTVSVEPGETYMIAANVFLSYGEVVESFVLRDKDNQEIDWSAGSSKVYPANGYQAVYAVVTANQNVATIQPRFIGNGKTEAKIKNVSLYKLKINGNTETSCIENEVLKVICDIKTCSVTVTDKRIGKSYFQCSEKLNDVIFSECVETDKSIKFKAFDSKGKQVMSYGLEFSPDNAATIDYFIDMPSDKQFSSFAFPQKSISQPGDYLVLPINEGMCFDYDDSELPKYEFVTYGGHGLCMPFFGITNSITGAGFISIIKDPDDCTVGFKRQETNCVGAVWKGQMGKFGYSRHLSQTFLTEGNHVAIAKHYREYAKQKGLLVTFEEKMRQRGRAGAENLTKLMGAVNIWSWYYDWNGHEASDFAKKIKDAGIENILWSHEQKAEVVQKINELGILTGRYDIYQDVMDPANYSLINGIHQDWLPESFPQDIAVDKNGDFVQAWPVSRKDGNGYVNCVALCDMTAAKYARPKIEKELVEKNYGARFFDTTTASALRECYSPAHKMTRTQSRQARYELLEISSKEHGLVTGSETGMDFVVPVCDYFEGMMSLGPYRREDAGRNVDQFFDNVPSQIYEFQLNEKRRIPLWELVYHDCCVAYWYWGDHNNTFNPQEIWDKRDNFNALYGVPPMYWIKDEAHFEANKDRFVKSYNASAEITKAVAGVEMISHEFLTADRSVQRTKFANGLEIMVDFKTNKISKN